MKAFMDKEFMLQSPTAQHLYHAYAEDMPICDYHCHIPPREIYENRRFDNIAQVWLGGRNPDGSYFGDHYKWRVMRSNGVPEEYITGDKPDRERFQKFAEALEMSKNSMANILLNDEDPAEVLKAEQEEMKAKFGK